MENPTPPIDDPSPRPLGFWLRAVDRLISREFATAFENEDVTRREWMILNVLDGSVEAPGFAARIARGKKLRSLAERGWVAEGDGAWTLTDEGRAAKARLSEVVDGIRSRVSGAVSDADLATTLASLEAIARELGGDDVEAGFGHPRVGRRGFGPGFGRRGFRPGSGRGFGPGFGPHRFDGQRFPDAPVHGGPGHCGGRGRRHDHGPDHDHGPGHDHGHGHAYERGFDAGFARGREERTA